MTRAQRWERLERTLVLVGVGYDAGLKETRATLESILADEPRILKDPEPLVAVSNLGESSVDFVVRPWVKAEDYWAVRFDLTRALKENIEAAGCSIPYPQQDVHMHQVNG